MKEIDVFVRMLDDFGQLQKSRKVPDAVAEEFQSRLPTAIIEFWLKYGWGGFQNGFLRICDPRPFDPFLDYVFRGDPDFKSSDLTLVGYTVFNQLKIWNRTGRTMLIGLEYSEVAGGHAKPNPDTGGRYSDAFSIGLLFYDQLSIGPDADFKEASERLGCPGSGKVYGFVPALQLGGEPDANNLHIFKAVEHWTFLAQLEPLKSTRLTDPEPGFPLGRIETGVRPLSRTPDLL